VALTEDNGLTQSPHFANCEPGEIFPNA